MTFEDVLEFEWDEGNTGKNKRHNVIDTECEEVYFDPDKLLLSDVLHSGEEDRFILLGRTRKDRLLFVVFTIRGGKVRVISARDTNNKERTLYEKTP